MYAESTEPTSARAVRRRIIDQLPFRSACAALAWRVAAVMVVVSAAAGCALAAGAVAGVAQPFVDTKTATWRVYFHAISAVVGGGAFGDSHMSTGVFAWGFALVAIAGYVAARSYLRRHRLPMLRDLIATPVLTGFAVGFLEALIAIIGRVGPFGPSPSRVFFLSGALAWFVVTAAFVTRSGDYRTFFWRHAHRAVDACIPSLRGAGVFFVGGGALACAALALNLATGGLSVPLTASAGQALALAGGNLLAAAPLLWAGGTLSIIGDPFSPVAFTRLSLYSSLGLGWTIALICCAVLVAVASSVAIALRRASTTRLRHVLISVIAWQAVALVLQGAVGLRVEGEWIMGIASPVLVLVAAWALATETFTRLIAPIIIAAIPALRRRDRGVLDDTLGTRQTVGAETSGAIIDITEPDVDATGASARE